MAGGMDELLDLLGFSAVQYADQTGKSNRKAELAKSVAGLNAEERSRSTSHSFEDRGLLRSGEHARAQALGQTDLANQLSSIDIGLADDMSSLDLQASQAKQSKLANNQLSDAQHDATLDDLMYAIGTSRKSIAEDDRLSAGLYP